MSSTAEQWYGKLGAGWFAQRFKHVALVVGGQVDPTDDRYSSLPLFAPNHMESGTGRLLAVDSAEEQAAESGKYLVVAGDVLYSKIRPALRKVIVAPSDGLCSADVYAIRPVRSLLKPRFLFYLLLSEGFAQYSLLESDRVAMPKINREALGECPMVFPALDKQREIVAFLDAKTASIDTLIAKQEQLLTLLSEKRQGLITQVVTKGLEPNVPMKPTGVDWMGSVPAHWKVARIRQVAKLESGHTPSRQHPEWWIPEECTIPWVSLADVWKLRDGVTEYLDSTAEKISELGLANSSARLLPAGTVILSRTASVGFSAIIKAPMATTQDFVNWICGPALLPEYLLYLLRAMTPEFARLTQGSVHRTIYMPDVARFMTAVPPLDEQKRIVAHIREELRRLDGLAQRAETMVEKLREYRQALITAAVTGQLDAGSAPKTALPTSHYAEAEVA